MKRKQILLLSLLSSSIVYSQVGVNTESPKSTFHVIPTKTDGSTAEGFIAPNLTRSQLISKDNKYTAAEKGTIVYITTLDGTVTSKTSKVTTVGYYYYDGSIWQQFATSAGGSIPSEPWRVQGSTVEATKNTDNIYQQGTVAIGSNTSNGYTFQVTGGSNVTSNSRVGSSTVVGAQSVGSTLSVDGNTTIGKAAAGTTPASGDLLVMGRTSIGHTKIENDKSLYVKGITLLDGVTQVGTSLNNTSLTVQGSLEVKGGSFKLNGNGAGAGKYLVSDANGKGTWTTLPPYPTVPTTFKEPWLVQGSTTQATTNAQNIYQTGSVAIGTGATVASGYKLDVAGTSNVSGNSRVGSSTVVGAQTVGTTLAVTGATTLSNALTVAGATTLNGTTTAKATNVNGQLKYKPTTTAVVVGQYLRASAVDGSVAWATLPATATTEPWQVQGGATLATSNAQNIYQMGSIGIGANTAVPAAYKLQVTGASNITGNSRVGSSTVVGAQTVGTTLSVTNTSTLTGNVGIGAAPNASYKLQVTGASNVTGNSRVASSTVVGSQTIGSHLSVTGNTGLGIAAPTQKLDVRGNEFVSGISKIGGTTALNSSAQLELADANKGFLPNRVALTSSTVKAPVAGAVDGMMVYNTATVAAQGLKPGFYYWRDTKWQRLVDEIPSTSINVRDLRSNVTSLAFDANNTDKGAILNFATTTGEAIVIPEDGAYAFSFRLYGSATIKQTTAGYLSFYYIALMVGTKIVDTAEMDIAHSLNSPVLTYSVTLGGSFQKGDVVAVRLSHNPFSRSPWALNARPGTTGADRTSMVWWKL